MFGHTEPFDEQYHCYSGAFADKPQLEGGDKILLPASAFEQQVGRPAFEQQSAVPFEQQRRLKSSALITPPARQHI